MSLLLYYYYSYGWILHKEEKVGNYFPLVVGEPKKEGKKTSNK